MADGCWVPGVLAVAGQLSSLRKLSFDAILIPTTSQEGSTSMGPADGDAGVQAPQPSTDAVLAGFICSMSGLQQLCKLTLDTNMMGPLAAAALGGLKQLSSLTSLRLLLCCNSGTRQLDLTPLSGTTGLLKLTIGKLPPKWSRGLPGEHISPMPPATPDGPFCLPSSLQLLQLHGPSTAPWLQHLPGCRQLSQLCIWGIKGSTAAVLELVVRHVPGLQALSMITVNDHTEYQPFSRHAVTAVTALKHLAITDSLYVETAADWEALGRLRALTYLAGLQVRDAPPQGWQHTRLVKLDCVSLCLLDPQVAAKTLVALPALQHVSMSVVEPYELVEDVPAVGAPGLRASPHLTSMFFFWRPQLPLVCLTPILVVAGSSLVSMRVCLSGAGAGLAGPSGPLPDLSTCTALRHLQLLGPKDADLGDLVGCLQPLAPTLEVLDLDGWRRISPAAAKVLQYVLPRLEQVSFVGCRGLAEEDPSTPAEEQLQRLQQALRQGLDLEVAESSDNQT